MRFFYTKFFYILALFCAICFQASLASRGSQNHNQNQNLEHLEQIHNCSVSIVISDKSSKKVGYETLFFGDGNGKSFGSGFILNNLNLPWGSRFQGSYMYVLTKYHVVEKIRGEEILVCTEEMESDDESARYNCQPATVELLDRDYDLAILRSDFTLGNTCSARFDFAEDGQIGDKITSFTNKLGLGLGAAFGHISAREKTLKRGNLLQQYSFIDMNIGYGSSGALVFDKTSKAIGVVSSIYSSNSNYVALMQTSEDALNSLERMSEMIDIETIFDISINDDLEISSPSNKELNGVALKFIAKRQVNSKPEAKYELFKFYSNSEATELPIVYTTKDNKLKRFTLTKPSI